MSKKRAESFQDFMGGKIIIFYAMKIFVIAEKLVFTDECILSIVLTQFHSHHQY